MKPCPSFPSIDLKPYPLHDDDGHLEFVLGMWFHTRDLVGKPCFVEAVMTLPEWPSARFHELWDALERTNQVTNDVLVNWADRVVA